MKASVGRMVHCRYTGYHRKGEDFNCAVITAITSDNTDPAAGPVVVELTVFGVGTIPFAADTVTLKETDDGSDRCCWWPPKVE